MASNRMIFYHIQVSMWFLIDRFGFNKIPQSKNSHIISRLGFLCKIIDIGIAGERAKDIVFNLQS